MKELLEEMAKMFKEVQDYVLLENEIEYPLEIDGINKFKGNTSLCNLKKVGSFVSIRPVSEDKKTFLGLYLGDLILENNVFFNKNTKTVEIIPHRNPAIFVFDLKKVVWGCESWWGFINTEDELRQITDADINNIWYVKALRSLEHGHKD